MTDKDRNAKAELGAEASSSKQELRDTDMEKVAGGTQDGRKTIHFRTYNDKGEHVGGGGGTVGVPIKEPDKDPGTDAGASSGTQTNTDHSKGVQMINNSGANNAGGINM